MMRKLGFVVLLIAGMWLVSACETLNGDPFEAAGNIALGPTAGCAVDNNTGELECWGNLELISGPTVIYGPFATPIDPGVQYDSVAVGDNHACAEKVPSGTGVRCWGGNSVGQLGDGTTTDSLSPVDVVGLPSERIVDLSAGFANTCATFETGVVYCWGWNLNGQLGDGTTVNTSDKLPPHPGPVVGPGQSTLTGIVRTAVGRQHSCALTTDESVFCWGYHGVGNLGVGSLPGGTTDVTSAQQLALTGVVSIASGPSGSCVITASGVLYCWGVPLGPGNPAFGSTSIPLVYAGFSQTPVQVSMGDNRVCARFSDGTAECVGSQRRGGLGDGSTGTGLVDTPVMVSGSGTYGYDAIYQGLHHSCAETREDGPPRIRCWGQGSEGQIGNGVIGDSPTPALVVRPF